MASIDSIPLPSIIIHVLWKLRDALLLSFLFLFLWYWFLYRKLMLPNIIFWMIYKNISLRYSRFKEFYVLFYLIGTFLSFKIQLISLHDLINLHVRFRFYTSIQIIVIIIVVYLLLRYLVLVIVLRRILATFSMGVLVAHLEYIDFA